MSTTSRWTRSAHHAVAPAHTEPGPPRVLGAELAPVSLGATEACPTLSAIAVRWQVARSAVGSAAPAGNARMLVMTVAVCGLGDARARISVELADTKTGERSLVHDAVAVSAEVIPDIRAQVHVEITGWLHTTVGPIDGSGDAPGGAWRLVYARTPVLDQLGVPGGRAEPTGVSVTPA